MEILLKIVVYGVAAILIAVAAFCYLRNVWFLVLTIRSGQFFSVHFVLRAVGVFFFPPLGIAMGIIPLKKAEDKEVDHVAS